MVQDSSAQGTVETGASEPILTPEPICETVTTDLLKPTHVVGIGASAGGLEALEQFFEAMPAESGMAFVVVQHLSPDFKSLMNELLAPRTSMPIHRVEYGMTVERDAIYLIPPKKEMIISGGRLLLTDKDPQQTLTLPIDRFFRSLAQDAERDAIAVVLSGTGSDGSRGIRDIHDAGGLVVVQSQDSAKFDGMPKSAVDTGVADLVLHPQRMPAALLRYIRHPVAAALMDDTTPAASENGMTRLFQLLRDEYGIDFSHYKPSTVGRRIERRLQMQNIGSLEEYVDGLAGDLDELNSLYKDLLIGVTKFYRDPEAFRRLQSEVLPELLMQSRHGHDLRIWVAGCGTGEEAYSLAMLVREVLETSNRQMDVKIFATDVHRTSIEFASAGVYPRESLSEIDSARIDRYFTRVGDGYQVAQELRQMIVFAHHNIIKDAPFTKLDLISCRNLLIYFQPNAQKKALSLFHFGLRTGGVLFLGPSESPAELSDEFESVDVRWKIYRKRRDIRLPADLRLAILPPSDHTHTSPFVPSVVGGRGWDGRLQGSYDALLNEFMPAAVLIDEKREVLHIFGGAERFLEVKGGRASTNIVDLVDSDLRIALSGALNRAEKEECETHLRGVPLKDDSRIRLGVKPIRNLRTDSVQMLITLEEESPNSEQAGAAPESSEVDINQMSRDRVEVLESELRYTRENLQATVEELETSNEELQAANEELVASNEELQSTNEELHSVNEELYTVNAEYQRKISELTQLTNDMDNLLRSTEIGTIFLDRKLCIRKFTPQISSIFHLLPQDLGRPIEGFAHHIKQEQLHDKIKTVLNNGPAVEQEVQDQQGKWYFLRILPYRSSTDDVEGAVLTLIDLSALKQVKSEAQKLHRQLTGILDYSTAGIFVKDLKGHYTLCNRAGARILNSTPDMVLGRTDRELLSTDIAEIIQSHDRKVADADRVGEFEETIETDDGQHTYLAVKFPLRDENSEIYGIGTVCADITARKQAEEAERLAVQRRDQFLAVLSHELRNPLGAIVNAVQMMDRRKDAETFRSTLRLIDRQASQMSRLLDDLLDVSRVTQGKIELRKEVVDLWATSEDAVDAVRQIFDQRNQQISLGVPEEPLYVEADPSRLQQLQVNLLTNASKYCEDGGHIWLNVTRQGPEVVISVRDNGVGVPREMQSRIFDLFVQSDSTLKQSDGGMGVGLTLARAIVEKHGGTITVHSDGPGTGSEFSVRLPLTEKKRSVQARLPSPAENAAETTILVVEDNPDGRETLCELLKMDGYRVLSAEDGAAGIEIMEREKPDVALIDIGLPDMSGHDVAQKVRNSRRLRESFIVALTGFGQESDRQAALKAGFDAHLVKPLDTARLAEILHERAVRKSN